jgi:putative acetyltransferase
MTIIEETPGHRAGIRAAVAAAFGRDDEADLVERGCGAVVVPGHPGYYPRFGFSAPLARRLASPFPGPFPGDAFMALELAEGALAGEKGSVRYPDAFGIGG